VELIGELTIFDLVVLVSFAGAVLVGFQQGLLRYLLNGIAVLVAFILASQLKGPIANAVGGVWNMGTPDQQELWIYVLLLVIGIVGGWFLIRTFYRQTRLPLIRQLDEVLGAAAGVLWVALIYVISVVALDTFFQVTDDPDVATMLGPIYEILNESFIINWLNQWLLPIVAFVLHPFVPPDVQTFLEV
jgi:uncharacterized membrane protein required for colicin V production